MDDNIRIINKEGNTEYCLHCEKWKGILRQKI